MNRKEWSFHLGVVFALWAADFLTKIAAMKFIGMPKFYGIVGLVLHYNPGAMLGTFSELPPVLRIVSLSTGGAFLFAIYLALQYLIPIPAKSLRLGMSILLSGILGNVTDRILRGAVTDFLIIGNIRWSTPAFNVADAVQWFGYALIVIFLVRDGHLFWPEQNFRKKLWVNPNFQMKYVMTLLNIGVAFVLITGVFFYTYLKITIDDLAMGQAALAEHRFLTPFFITFSVIAAGFLIGLFIIARELSHRTAGPLYAFEKFLEDLLAGKGRALKLRAGDEFRHLEELATKLKTQFGVKEIPTEEVPPTDDGTTITEDTGTK